MAVSTIFTSTADQVWIAKQGHSRTWYGNFEGLKDRLVNVEHCGQRTEWEETCQDSKGRAMRPCSRLMVCTSSTRYGGQYVGEVWRDTGWRMWREQ